MLSHYLRHAFRQLVKHKLFTLINLSGLTIGMAASLLIGLYVWDEWHFDDFHESEDRIYRLTLDNLKDGEQLKLAHVFPEVTPEVAGQIPGIEKYVDMAFTAPIMLGHEDTYVVPNGGETYFASAQFFDLFSFGLETGNPEYSLSEPYSIVLTSALAKQLFGKKEPVGQLLEFYVYGGARKPLKVTGIINEVPENSHLQFNHLVSYSTLQDINRNNDNWSKQPVYSYVKLQSGVNEQQFNGLLSQSFNDQELNALDGLTSLNAQPLSGIHLGSEDLEGDKALRGDLQMVIVLGLVSLGILLMASSKALCAFTAHRPKKSISESYG